MGKNTLGVHLGSSWSNSTAFMLIFKPVEMRGCLLFQEAVRRDGVYIAINQIMLSKCSKKAPAIRTAFPCWTSPALALCELWPLPHLLELFQWEVTQPLTVLTCCSHGGRQELNALLSLAPSVQCCVTCPDPTARLLLWNLHSSQDRFQEALARVEASYR